MYAWCLACSRNRRRRKLRTQSALMSGTVPWRAAAPAAAAAAKVRCAATRQSRTSRTGYARPSSLACLRERLPSAWVGPGCRISASSAHCSYSIRLLHEPKTRCCTPSDDGSGDGAPSNSGSHSSHSSGSSGSSSGSIGGDLSKPVPGMAPQAPIAAKLRGPQKQPQQHPQPGGGGGGSGSGSGSGEQQPGRAAAAAAAAAAALRAERMR
jgi:hypothetical protein